MYPNILDDKAYSLDNVATTKKTILSDTLIEEWREHPVTDYLMTILERDRALCMSFILARALSGEDTKTEVTQLKDLEHFLEFIKELKVDSDGEDDEEDSISENTRH